MVVDQYKVWKNFAVSLCKLCSSKILQSIHHSSVPEFTLPSTKKDSSLPNGSLHSEGVFMNDCNNANLFTETDQLVESIIQKSIAEKFPSHIFMGEETVTDKLVLTDDPTWIVDPIDGTMNFVHSLPGFCISIGILHNKEPVVGVVYEVFHDKMYYAVKGQGAFCNGEPLTSSNCDDIKKCLFVTETTLRRDEQSIQDFSMSMSNLLKSGVAGIRMTGSAALNMVRVAEGTADVYYESGPHIWDVAAGVVILTEAGGHLLHPKTLHNSNLVDRQFLAIGSNKKLAFILSPLLVHNVTLEHD